MEERTKQIAINLAVLLGLGVLSIIILDKTTSIFEPEKIEIIKEVPAPVQEPAVSEFVDYDATKEMKSLEILSDFTTWTPDGKTQDDKKFVTFLVDKGSVSRAYILVDASLEDGKPLTAWESVYLILNYQGGHLFRPLSLPVPKSDTTVLLYAINSVPYVTKPYSEQKTPQYIDWSGLFKQNAEIRVETFISSYSRPAKINKLVLYYECADGPDSCDVKL